MNNDIIENPLDIANTFNSYFVNIASNLNSNKSPPTVVTKDKIVNNTIFLNPVSSEEISTIICGFKNKISSGPDGIPMSLIKQCPHLLGPITDLVNASLTTGYFPDAFKKARVVPVYKKGKKDNIENYRPISLLPAISKILEKAMFNRVMTFLNKHEVLSHSQFGFRKNKSINDALYSFSEHLLSALDNKNPTIGIFLDQTKAFDVVNHNILLEKLNNYGIRGTANAWFSSYLSNRRQMVQIDSQNSDYLQVKCGVPQGSLLGPLLFLIYINDLPAYLPLSKNILYADDTNILISDIDSARLQAKANKTLENLQVWLNYNRLHLNISKTNYINFCPFSLSNLQIMFNNVCLKEVVSSKFLGIWVDSKSSWNTHISYLAEKVCKITYAMRILSRFCNIELLRTLYFGNINSVISYGIPFWGTSPNLTRIFKLQKRIIKIMMHVSNRTHTKPLFKKLNILPVPCIFILETVCFIHANELKFPKNSHHHHHDTRRTNDFHLTSHRTSRSLKFINHTGLILYNKLPHSFKHSKLKLFKIKVRNLLMEHVFYSTQDFISANFQTL